MKIIAKVNPKCKILPKFTTRQKRKDDDESIIIVDEIPAECDYVYRQYEELYGFSSRMLVEYLKAGKIGDGLKSLFVYAKNSLAKKNRK